MIKVLAVDDEEPIRQWLKYCISRFEGFSCITAASANEGIELFRQEPPDIVISDIEMPGMSGLEMLRQLQQLEPELCGIVLTSHEDFEYARTALKLNTVEYMLKTEISEESLLAVLERAGEQVRKRREDNPPALMQREHFLQAVALGKNTELLTTSLLEQYHIPLTQGPVIAIDLWNVGGAVDIKTELSAIPRLDEAIVFTLGADHVFLLVNILPNDTVTQGLLAAGWQELLTSREGISCGISNPVGSVAELRTAIEQARRRCMSQYYQPQGKVFWEGAVPPETPEDEELFHLEYMSCLLNQDFQAAYARLTAFADTVLAARPSDISLVKKLFLTSTISFLHFAANTVEDADAQEIVIKEQFVCSDSFGKLMESIERVFKPYLQHNTGLWRATAPIRQAIEYMEQHYADKITLSEISALVSFSPEHFSRLFTKETGVNFVTYMINLRMKNAVKLLESTNDKVYEIAEKVGFSSLSYFSTTFKKKFGQNPYEYQISYQKGTGRII